MNPSWRRPAFGVLVAIAITTAMDASGLSMFSALPLLPLMGLFWYWERLARTEMGFVWGRLRHYGPALLHPVLVLGLIALTGWITGAVNLERTNWQKAWLGMAIGMPAAILMGILTEEGFFRGWLWASLKRTGLNNHWVLAWSSLAFALWHLSAVFLETGFNPPLIQSPILMLNVAVLGVIWGLLRLISGSVVVASVGHGVWNVLAYGFFGFGIKAGALGIHETAIYGPEVGVLGLVLNFVFAAGLWQWRKHQGATAPA